MPDVMDRAARIFVTGHRGLVGSAIFARLKQAGFRDILTAPRSELDLRNPQDVDQWFQAMQPRYVIHAAGKVGGIGANVAAPVDFFYANTLIHATVLQSAWRHGVEKLLYLASSCVYPRDCPQPMREDYLLTGPLESTNEGYALAKIGGLKSCQYYRRQHGCCFISTLPTNLYGPGDTFDPQASHVIPSLIMKFHEAKRMAQGEVTIWGTGTPRREFLHVADLADACLFLMDRYDEADPINVGTGEDISIADLAGLIREVVYPEARLTFDTTKPDGTPRKLLDVERLHLLGWRHQRDLRVGLAETYEWFLQQQ